MSYTFTSPIRNTINRETLDHSSEIRSKINGMFENAESILMVGWRHDSDSTFVQHILDCGKKLTIVEVFSKNLEVVPPNVTATCADIRDYVVDKPYDMFLWQHGPEHVSKLDVAKFLRQYGHQFKYIVLETPNGHYPQGMMYGNPYEEHVSDWVPSDYINLGLEYITYSGPNNEGFIIAYKNK